MDLPQNLFFHLTSETKYQMSHIQQDRQVDQRPQARQMTGHSITAMDKLILMETIIHALERGTQLGTQNRIRKTKL